MSSLTKLQLPALGPRVPIHLDHILMELDHSIKQDAPGTSLKATQNLYGFLLQMFSSFLADACKQLNGPVPAAEGVEDQLFLINAGLDFLSAFPQKSPLVDTLISVFLENGKPKAFTTTLGLLGRPKRGFLKPQDFLTCKPTNRRKSESILQKHFPPLSAWLEAAANFFQTASISRERTSEHGEQTIVVELGDDKLETLVPLTVSDCPLCIPAIEIEVPRTLYPEELLVFVPQRTPEVLLELLDELHCQMNDNDPAGACRELRNCLEFLIRYFAAVCSATCSSLEALPKEALDFVDNSKSLPASEKLLNLCLDRLKRMPDSEAAAQITECFFARSSQYDFIPRWHTEVLSLRGQLSAWCLLEPGEGELEDPEVCKLEFEKHILTLCEWLRHLGAYLARTEHFFNSTSSEGSLEFSLRVGDKFVEVAQPNYVLWLDNPRPSLEQSSEEASVRKPLIREPIDIPETAPQVLFRILTRMDLYLRLGDPIESCVSMRDAMDYLTRYFAGLSVAAFKRLGDIPEEIVELASSSLSVHQCEKLLWKALESLGKSEEDELGGIIRQVFFYQEGLSELERPTGAHSKLLELDADPNNTIQYIAEFCSLKPGEGALSHPARSKRELERFLPSLQDWLAMAKPLFDQFRHFEEKPDKDGKTELVVEYQDQYLELVAPDYVFYILPGSDVVPDIEAPELPPLSDELDYDLIDQPTTRMSKLEAARNRPFLVHKVELIGTRENSQGVKCEAGYIVLTNAGGGSLSGEAVSTDAEAIEVTPRRFRGNKVQLSYWVNKDAIPETHEVYIELKTAQGLRTVSLYELVGKARTRAASEFATAARMALASAAFITLFLFTFWLVSYHLDNVLTTEVGLYYKKANLYRDAPDVLFSTAFYRQVVGYLYLLTAGLVPVLVGKIFRTVPPATQELLQDKRRLFMVLPSIVIGLCLLTPLLNNHFTSDPDFSAMHLRRLFLYFVGLNLGSTYYQELSLTERFDDLLINKDLVKWLPPTVGWLAFATIVLTAVAG